MNRAKNDIVASITRAKLELEDALDDIKHLPMLDPMVLGFIAHALNNYLRVSSGTIELLGDALEGDPRQDLHTWIKGLQDSTTRMRNLVKEIQGGARKAPPQMNFEKVDLSVLVERTCNFHRSSSKRKDIALIFKKSSPPPPKVRTDRVAVAVVLDNLLSNAVKFSPPHKMVTVEIRQESGQFICRVEDEGPGINIEDRDSLFRRGAKLRAKPTGGESSNGYGLAVAAELIAHLGGEIGCEAAPEKGACFFFKLPSPRPHAKIVHSIRNPQKSIKS